MSVFRVLPFCFFAIFLSEPGFASNDGGGAQPPVQGVIMAGGVTVAPWRFYIGNPNDWMRPVKAKRAKTKGPSNVDVELLTESSGLSIISAQWKKGSVGQILWQASHRINAVPISEQNGALSLVVRVDTAPSQPVSLRMDCGYPCSGALKFADILSALPEGEWVRIGIPLSCFANAGADLRKIDSPAVIITSGDLGLSIADLRLAIDVPHESLINCAG